MGSVSVTQATDMTTKEKDTLTSRKFELRSKRY